LSGDIPGERESKEKPEERDTLKKESKERKG
jgi:hypothetical protein